MVPTDPPLPVVFTRALAVEAGLTRNQVEQRLHNGRWKRLVRGAFCEAERWGVADPTQRHLLLARGVLLTRAEPGPHVLSHLTAAAVHGLPVSAPALATVWMTAAAGFGRSTRYSASLRREVALLPAEHMTERAGLPVTTTARTVADCLRHLPLTESVPLGDAALHGSRDRPASCSREALERLVGWQASWPYAQAAVRGLRLLDPRRESVFESRSALVMHAHRLPAPIPQAVICDRHGNFAARVDFFWPKYGVVGEADGAGKYRNGDPARVIREEKDRQARLEELGLMIVRWDWRHLFGDPPELVVRVARALASSDTRRFTGYVA